MADAASDGHIFVSYAGEDLGYVLQLVDHLRSEGINIWWDEQISTSQRWADVLEHKINTCAAVVVVMSPAARQSHWVGVEIDHAFRRNKRIFPLLLHGKPLYGLGTIQYESAQDGRLPSHAFVEYLRNPTGAPTTSIVATAPRVRQVGVVPNAADSFQHRPVAESLDHALTGQGSAIVTPIVSGLGGVGKTQLAASVARQLVARGALDVLVWVTATSAGSITSTMAQAGAELADSPADDPVVKGRAFLTWLATTQSRWLIVFDDLAEPNLLDGWWPPASPTGRVLVTTRRRDSALVGHGRLVDLEAFTESEALAYLADKLRDAPRRLAGAPGLARELSYLPVALAQAASFVVDRDITCAEFCERLAKHPLASLAPDSWPDEYSRSVAATLLLAVSAADRLAPEGLAQPLLAMLSLLDSNGIPRQVVGTQAIAAFLAEQTGISVDTEQSRDAVGSLARLSLVATESGAEALLRIHAVVQRVMRDQAASDLLAAAAHAAIDGLLETKPDVERDGLLVQRLRTNTIALRGHVEAGKWQPDAHTLAALGLAFLFWFYRFGILSDLDDAIATIERATVVAALDHPDRSIYLANLSFAMQARFRRYGDVSDLDAAQAASAAALESTPPDSPDRAAYLSNLSGVLRARFERFGLLADLHEAVHNGREAVTSTPSDYPKRAIYQSNLGSALRLRFERTGALADLGEAIEVDRQAVAATPVDHPDRAGYLSNLGSALRFRFERSGALADLGEAIEVDRQAVAGTPVDHPDRAGYLSNLGSALRFRFERTGVLADLDQAIEAGHHAVAATPVDHPARAGYLSNLGSALRSRFEHTGGLVDLDQAIEVDRQAVAATPPDRPDQARYLSNLGSALRFRFERTEALADLDQAIEAGQQAVAATPADHPNRAAMLFNLGAALRTRSERTGNPAEGEQAAAAFHHALHTPAGPPLVRAQAGRNAADLAADNGDWHNAEADLAVVVDDLLPVLTSHGLASHDRQYHLARLQGLASEFVRATLGTQQRDHVWPERIVKAWRRLEQTRAILLAQALETRRPSEALRQLAPHLSEEYEHLRDLLAATTAEWPRSHPHDDVAESRLAEQEMIRRRTDAAARWVGLLHEIRLLPGFESFALPPPIADLHAAAGDGTVVAITVTNHGCGALLLNRDDVDYLELPALTAQRAFENANAFLRAVNRGGQMIDTDEMKRVLEWLWDAVAEPVLDRLGYGPSPADPASPELWPRVWWMPNGPLSLLPLHAAGYLSDPPGSGRSVLDRVVSSYTPSVRALGDARLAQATVGTSALVVGINNAADPQVSPLIRAEEEARRVHLQLHADRPALLGPQATHQEVISALPASAWAHFACHAFADNDDPSEGFLALFDQRLTANELLAMRLDNPYLAYLSACATGVGSLRLLDESIHLASAFQLAGYPHVVATLWPINDLIAADLARDFYAIAHPSLAMWKSPAHALHTTVHAFRTTYFNNPHLWASHVHFGP